jgi:uncharacterized protein (TIGR02246 family)
MSAPAPQTDLQAMDANVADLFHSFSETWTSGDVDAFAALWTEDAIFWPPTGEELQGRDAIRIWTAQLGETKHLAIETLRAEPFGEVIFVVGNFTQDITLPSGRVDFLGGFTAILRAVGGKLLFHRLVSFRERQFPA